MDAGLIQKVFAFLSKLKEGQVVIVKEVAKKDPQGFIEAVKEIIDAGEPFEFTSDYSKVKRIYDIRPLIEEFKKTG